MTERRRRMTKIESYGEIPLTFASEEEEARYWDTHELGAPLVAQLRRPDDPRLPPVRREPTPLHAHRRRSPAGTRSGTLLAAKQGRRPPGRPRNAP